MAISFHTIAHPLPSSFPLLSSGAQEYLQSQRREPMSSRSLKMIASLSTSKNICTTFQEYALVVDRQIKTPNQNNLGLSLDDLKELSNDMWQLYECLEA